MKYCTLLFANMKKQKGSLIGIFLLMFIISISLGCVLTIRNNSASYIEGEMERLHVGDIIYWEVQVSDIEQLKEEIREVKGTADVEEEKILLATGKIHEEESSVELQGVVYQPDVREYSIFHSSGDGLIKGGMKLKKGEILVPISFRSIYQANEGDTMQYHTKDGKVSTIYTIRGFYEDPIMGSSMMGMKSFFMTQEDYDDFSQAMEKTGEPAINCYRLHVFHEKQGDETLKKFQNRLNEETSVDQYTSFAYQRVTINGFMLLLQNIFFGFLVSFVVVLLIVTMIVIGHSISSSIEQDYVDMGILKAVGYRNKDMVFVQMTQYMITILAGQLMGLSFASSLVKLVNKMIVTVTGIIIPDRMPLLLYVITFGLILILFASYILVKTRTIAKISPIRAIRGGKEDVFFSSRLRTQIHKKGLSFHMALRQLESGKKQYVSACMITALLVFILSLCGRIQNWLGPDGQGLMNTMGIAAVDGRTYDFAIRYEGNKTERDELQKEVEKSISGISPIFTSYLSISTTGQVNHSDYLLNVISKPEYLHIVEGRACMYDNEVTITKTVAKETGIHVGDRIIVGAENKSGEYMVTGFHQCANDMGANFVMGTEGYEKLRGNEVDYYVNYIVEDRTQKTAITDMLTERFADKIDLDINTWSGIDGIVVAAAALQMMMYVICAIFIFVVISMTGGKILYKEQHDLGVYKSLGFSSGVLRLSFAIRFGVVAAIGSIFGILISILLTDSLVGVIFMSFGVSNFRSVLDISQMVRPAICVMLLFFLFAFVCAGKIKKTDPGILITE